MNDQVKGHLAAFLTIVIWGTTFISTKLLLVAFQPVEILLIRFVIGYLALCLISFRPIAFVHWRQEGLYMLAGLCGICLYYLLENIALTFTYATNIGVIISIAPFFTAVLTAIVFKQKEALHLRFFLGFAIAMAGISLLSFGNSSIQINPLGDLLGGLAAFVWACYAILTKKISALGYSVIKTTKRTFFYGILWMIPCLMFFDVSWDITRLLQPDLLAHFLFLGLGASALCFVTWNHAVSKLGAVKTSVYIYMVPVITVVTSFLVLQEPITAISSLGTVLTLIGLFLSQNIKKKETNV